MAGGYSGVLLNASFSTFSFLILNGKEVSKGLFLISDLMGQKTKGGRGSRVGVFLIFLGLLLPHVLGPLQLDIFEGERGPSGDERRRGCPLNGGSCLS